jgi:uncharacterized protein (TIGR02147 family)
MKAQIAIQNLLRKRLADAQINNPQYSLRAFSNKVGVHVGALSSIMNGKRNVSRDLAERVVARLMLDPQERAEILELFPVKRSQKEMRDEVAQGVVLNARYRELSAQQFKVIAEWEHFGVMALLRCPEKFENAAQVAARMGITEARARLVIERLIELKMVNVEADGSLKRSEENFRTSDDVADISVRKAHDESLELARKSLYRDSVEERDFSSITIAVDPEKLSMAKERIRQFQDELAQLLDTGTKTEVYRVSMQMFPLSVRKSEK